MKTYIKIITICGTTLTPLFVFGANVSWLQELVRQSILVFGRSIAMLITIALLFFIWGVVRFIFNSGDEKIVEEGKRIMLWGVIGLFVLIAVWGLVRLVENTTGIHPQGAPLSPYTLEVP